MFPPEDVSEHDLEFLLAALFTGCILANPAVPPSDDFVKIDVAQVYAKELIRRYKEAA